MGVECSVQCGMLGIIVFGAAGQPEGRFGCCGRKGLAEGEAPGARIGLRGAKL